MLRIPTGRLKREWSLLAIFGRANRSYRDISNTWLGHGFLSSNPTCPANQSGSVGYVRVTGFGVVGRALACRDEFPTKMRGRGNSTSLQLVKEDVNLNLRYHVMTIGSGNDQWEASLECDGGSGGCEDPRAGFGVTQEEAEEAAIAAARKSSWREVDGRWLCPFCYWRVCYWQAISTAKPAHSQQRAELRPGQKQRIAVRAMQPIL